MKRKLHCHIIIRLLKISDKDIVLKSAQRKRNLLKILKIFKIAYFSLETIQAKIQRMTYLLCWRKKIANRIFLLQQKNKSYLWIDSIITMSVLPKLIYRFSARSFKITAIYFVDIDKWCLSLYRETKDPE